jgi:hypothetical protein
MARLNVWRTGALAARPWSYAESSASRNLRKGESRDACVLLSANRSRGDVEPMARLAEACDAPDATGVMPRGMRG